MQRLQKRQRIWNKSRAQGGRDLGNIQRLAFDGVGGQIIPVRFGHVGQHQRLTIIRTEHHPAIAGL